MIVSDRFLREIRTFFQMDLLKIPYVKTVAKWCLDYYDQYNKVPNKTIQKIFDDKVQQNLDEDEAKLIAEFLHSISKEYETEESFNYKYALDQAESYFRHNSLEALSATITNSLVSNNLEETEALISNYKRVTKATTKGVNVYSDRKAIKKALSEENDYLFKLPGAWGDLVGPFSFGDFVAIYAPGGRGKTFGLLEIAIRTSRKGFKTLFVSLEMTENKVLKRIYQNILGESIRPRTLQIPILDCIYNQIGECTRSERRGTNNHSVEGNIPEDYTPCTSCKRNLNFRPAIYYVKRRTKGISYYSAVKKGEEIEKRIGEGDLKLACYPGDTLTIDEFQAHLDNLEHYENFIPTFILTDYADFFKASGRSKETRHQINEIWKGHRSLAQQRNCVMITCTHTYYETFERNIKQGDAVENKAKYNHLTHAFGLNQTSDEKRKCLMRIGNLKVREGEFYIDDEIVVLQQLGIGKFYLDSYRKPPDDSNHVKNGTIRPQKARRKEMY